MQGELTTLGSIYKDAREKKDSPMTSREKWEVNMRLLLLVQLSSLQINIAWEIEQIFREHGIYNFNIKHNHKRIVELIKGCGNNAFWKDLTQEQIYAIGEDADSLEDMIYHWCGLRGRDED